jgi:heat shock protein HslJ
MLTPALAALLMSVTLGACASSTRSGDAAAAPLEQVPEGTAWRLERSNFAGLEAGADTGIRMAFADGKVTGDSGCNRFFGAARISDGKLLLGPIAASKRACIGPRMDSERALFEALRQLDQAFIVDGRLRLNTADGAELVFIDDPVLDQ